MKQVIYRKHRQILENVFTDALAKMSPDRLIDEQIRSVGNKLIIQDQKIDLTAVENIWLFGSGKAAPLMAYRLETILGDRIKDGIIVTHDTDQIATTYVQQFKADHPLPTENTLAATYELVDLAKKVGEQDLVLFCITGGSSSLLELPGGDLELDELRATFDLLLNSGANIQEMNTVRKHLSEVKGGRLLRSFPDVPFVNLVISDVPGDALPFIGSGPTVPDGTTFEEAFQVLKRFDIWNDVPHAVRKHIAKGMDGVLEETVRPDELHIQSLQSFLVGTAHKMGEASAELLRNYGYQTATSDEAYSGTVRNAAKRITADAVNVLSSGEPVEKPAALIYFGESEVQVTGSGLGGRNMELALTAALSIEGQHHITLLSAGTDGRDGPTDAAGAIITSQTILQARKDGLDPEAYLQDNDSYHFFEQTGDLIKTGATGNNVMDIQMVLIE